MGEVFLARDPHIDRQLAIKTVRLSGASRDAEEHKQRLLREAKAAGRLIHPNVVTLFDAGEIDGILFLAFELVDGPDLGRRLSEPPPLSLDQVLQLIGEIASALDYAHHEGIIHRDIKPSNILIGNRGQAKVADFGLAKLKDESVELTRTGSVVGSPQYMSPEQVRGEALDGRTDVFSLGVLAYELLTRLRPFGGQTISTLVFEILSKEPVSIGQLRPGLPNRLATLVHRMLAKDLAERTPTAREVIDEIQRVRQEVPLEILAAPAVPMVDDSAPTALLGSSSSPASPSASPPAGPASRTVVAQGQTPPPIPQAPVPPTVVAPISPYTPLEVSVAGPVAPVPSAVLPPPPPPAHSPSSHPASPHTSGAVPSQPLPTDAIASQPVGTGTYATRGSRSWGRVLAAALGLLLLVAVGGGAWWLGSRDSSSEAPSEGERQAEGSTPESTGEQEGSPLASSETGPETSTATRPVGPGSAGSEGTETGLRSTVDPTSSSPPPSTPPSSAAPPSTQAPSAPSVAETPPQRPASSPEAGAPPATGSAETPPAALPSPPPPRPREPARQVPSRPPAGEPVATPWLGAFDALAAQASQEISGGRFFHFDIEPPTAIVRVWRRGERRQRVMGQAEDYASRGKNTRTLEVPESGDYLFTVMVDGYPDLLVRAQVGDQGATTNLVRHRFSAGSTARSDRIQVSRAVSFDGTPADAQVLVDGVPRGPASRWPGGLRWSSPKNMKLRPGIHTITIEAPGYKPFEVEVEVSRAASQKMQKIQYLLRR